MNQDTSSRAFGKSDRFEKDPAEFYTMNMNYRNVEDKNVPPFWVTRYKLSPFWNSPLHSHEYMQINYVCRGRAVHLIRDQQYRVENGDFFIIPPYVAHRLGSLPGEDAEVIQFEFLASFIHQSYQNFEQVKSYLDFAYLKPFLVQNDSVKARVRLSAAARAEIEADFREILTEKEKKQEGYELIIRSILFKLLVLFGREYDKTDGCGDYYGQDRTQRQYILDAVDFIHENYQKNLTVESVSRKFMISTSYFSFLFKKVTSKPFVKYLNGIRVRKARELLQNTDEPVSEIMAGVGFRSLNNFEKIFRQEAGMSPLDCRRRRRGNDT